MGIFGAIGKAITGPFRGIGKLLQGDVKGMLGAFGDTAKIAAPFLAGPLGLPAAIGIGAAGGAAQTLDDPDNSFGDFLKGGFGGGLVGSLGGIGKLIPSGTGGKIFNAMKDVGGWITSNPELATAGAGTALDVYGAEQNRQQYESQLAYQREREEEQRKMQKMQMFINMMSSFRPRY